MKFFKMLFVLVVALLLCKTSNARSITLVNRCSEPVWFGLLPNANSPWIGPADNIYELTANGGSSFVEIPPLGWSGVIAGRTSCTDEKCLTADCRGGKGACTTGFEPPATQAEFTLKPNERDNYDVELINGYNIPISITPKTLISTEDPYFCGTPGARQGSPGFGGCSWNFKPPFPEYNWVEGGGKECKSKDECTGNEELCGLSFNPGHDPLLRLTCGRKLGLFSANQICGIQRNYGAPFYCSDLVVGQESITWYDLYSCQVKKVDTCYRKDVASPSCCGCVNWNELNIPVPPPPLTLACYSSNPHWTEQVLPTLRWLKEACPTAYVYPFDDKSGGFPCGLLENGVNTMEYTITFCPQYDTDRDSL